MITIHHHSLVGKRAYRASSRTRHETQKINKKKRYRRVQFAGERILKVCRWISSYSKRDSSVAVEPFCASSTKPKIYMIDEYSHALWRSKPLDQQLSKTISIKSAIWASLLGNMTHMRLTLSKHASLSKIAFARPRQSVFDALVLGLGLVPRG